MCVTQAAMAGLQLGTQYGQQQTQYSMNNRRNDAITKSALNSLDFSLRTTLDQAEEINTEMNQAKFDRFREGMSLQSTANNQAAEQGVVSLDAIQKDIARQEGELETRFAKKRESVEKMLLAKGEQSAQSAYARIVGLPDVAAPNLLFTTMNVASQYATEENMDKANTWFGESKVGKWFKGTA